EQRLREENQDCYGVFELPDYTLAIVCDGMGGHVGGAQASSLAVRTIHDTLNELQGRPILQALEEAIERTNLVIYEAARKNHRLMGMGTTAVVAAITNDAVYLAHVGDSRVYLLRRGQVQQLTRDHTMVNLFVDAELLSPEDAATHPEAHVLSRSLGVERQVDVELASPIPLEPGDVVFLCSDGVHGVITDWELANVEWGAPHSGVAHVLNIIATREGDDNATAVAVMMGTSFEDVPPTRVPEPRRFDEIAPSGGITAVPVEDASQDPGTAGLSTGTDSSGYIVYEDQPLIEPAPTPHQGPSEMVLADPTAPPAPPRQTQPPPPPRPQRPQGQGPPRALLAIIPVFMALFMLMIAMMVAIFLLIPGDDDGQAASKQLKELHVDNPHVPRTEPPPPAAPRAEEPKAVPAEAEEVAPDLPLFAPKLPPPPRRLPNRASQYTQPPPGGPLQFQAIHAARRRDCPGALDAVQEAMRKVSIDHATLYRSVWLCFNEAHQRKLEHAVAPKWVDLIYQLPHFDGTPEKKQVALKEHPELKRVPSWYRPAVGGVEYRLEHFTADEQMDDVMSDLLGEETIADHLAKDVHMEALAAEGLSRVPPAERTPALEEAWARRVYITAWALQNRPGRLLDQHRPQLMPELRALLDAATSERVGPDGARWKVPKSVTQARAVAEGAPAPTLRPSHVAPRQEQWEASIEEQLRDNDEQGPTIHGGN
ncbi:MAG TPA: serine/threonine-protein phosphatase, partial [Deltaproteobacteria bacterium]|nr:serine/threonine-protein phosphatase [Deltaproteobacteria bacterium]